MKIERKIFFASLGCGVTFWISSSIIGYYLFYRGRVAFIELLFKGMPEHGTYAILATFALFAIFGIIVSKLVARLEESQKKLEFQNNLSNKIIESLTHPFYVIDTNDYSIKIANSSAYAFGGHSADICYALTHNLEKPCMGPDNPCPIEEVKGTKKPVTVEHTHFDSDGNVRNIEVHGFPIFDDSGNVMQMIEYCIDITARRQAEKLLEDEIQRIDKLETIGVLAGGIAHDFNNIMTSIMGNISLALSTSDMEKISRRLRSAENSCIRARDLTKQLLIFSKGGMPVKKTGLISDFIRESIIFALRGSKVRADFHLDNNLMPVNIDEEMMNQVINNLVINAIQAMPKGGLIDVFAENFIINEFSNLPLKPGNYVRISIQDHGVGIPKEHIQRIFDPYFTTKQHGHGFGLSESYSIIKKHDGHIAVVSTLGVGTTFHIYLPVSYDASSLGKPSTDDKMEMGKGKILLMDDDKDVRYTITDMLTSIGYKVKSAMDGDEAINLYKQAMSEGQNFSAVILDLTVQGGMGGLDALHNLRKIDPDVKAILSSAYMDDNVMSNFEEYGFMGVISKPYKLKELSQVLNKVIKG